MLYRGTSIALDQSASNLDRILDFCSTKIKDDYIILGHAINCAKPCAHIWPSPTCGMKLNQLGLTAATVDEPYNLKEKLQMK